MPNNLHNDRATWLKGPGARCSHDPAAPLRARRLVLLGAPGVGKGTQAERLCARLGACHLSTGDIFRCASATVDCERSPAMSRALQLMRSGELVTDETVLALISERTACMSCQGGFVLDGFPRTVPQAEALEAILESKGVRLDAVINYVLPTPQIIARLSGRQTCPKCKAVFHQTTHPPKHAWKCDRCDTDLIQREDDRPEAVRVRLAIYETQTAPLISFYRARGLLKTVSAEGSADEIVSRTLAPFSAGLPRIDSPASVDHGSGLACPIG